MTASPGIRLGRLLAGLVLLGALASCGVTYQSRLGFISQFSHLLDARLTGVLGDVDRRPEYCLPKYAAAEDDCPLVHGANSQPSCGWFNQCASDVFALQVRASLLQRPEARAVLERDTAHFCTFITEPSPPGTPVLHAFGCEDPGPPFRLWVEMRPRICIVAVTDGETPDIVESYAVRYGLRVRDRWCETAFTPAPSRQG